jgi:beta-fructofuranosidase
MKPIVLSIALAGGALLAAAAPAPTPAPLQDKTLVAWVSPAHLSQKAGSVLTIDDGDSHFDGIVFAELSPRRWMPGSEGFNRTPKQQAEWAEETADARTVVQVALVHQGREVTLYREGRAYARHTLASPPPRFGPRATVLFGRRHLDAGDSENSFTGRILDARVYSQALTAEAIAALKPGQAGGPAPWAWWSFADQGLREKTGRFTGIELVGDVRLEGGSLVLNGKGASVITTCPGDPGEKRTPAPKAWSFSGPVPEEAVRSARLLRERLLADPYRPGYHFCVPEDMGMPGDPNGAFYHQGRYHLMYLYNRSGAGFCWGHISSQDLVHWRHHPDAIGPGGGDEGCFSGGAFVDDDGTAYLSYWMLWGARGIGLAKSTGPRFDLWKKPAANPVIQSTEWGVTEAMNPDGSKFYYGSADPSNIWKKDGRYYMLTGNLLVLNKIGRAAEAPLSEQGDRLYLFASDDLKTWQYRGVFYERNPKWTERSEDNMCPSFLPLPATAEGGPPSGKHLLLFISHNLGCQYYVGDYRQDRFHPDNHGRMTWVDSTFFAPEALVDQRGRQIMWAWLVDNPPGEKEKGWSGVYGLPRTLWLGADGTLRMRPVPELETLRGPVKTWPAIHLASGESRVLEGVPGTSCELRLEIEPGAGGRCGVKVRAAPDGGEETLLYFEAGASQLVFDSTHSGAHGRKAVERAPLALAPGEPLILRIFVDQSVVEVFANDRQAICRRVYPTRSDSTGVSLFATGAGARFQMTQAWEMTPSNPY